MTVNFRSLVLTSQVLRFERVCHPQDRSGKAEIQDAVGNWSSVSKEITHIHIKHTCTHAHTTLRRDRKQKRVIRSNFWKKFLEGI